MDEERNIEPPRETSPSEATAKFFTDDNLKTFELRTNDGNIVRVNREFLAARGGAFYTLLVNDLDEAATSIDIDFSEATVLALYEYACTETVPALRFEKAWHTAVEEEDIRQVQGLVSLAVAAAVYELPSLHREACSRLHHLLRVCPSLAFPIFEVCKRSPRTEDRNEPLEEVTNTALALLRANKAPMDTLALTHLSEQCLEEVLQDAAVTADESYLFTLVQKWNEADASTDRSASSKRVVKNLKLHKISPFLLDTVVEPSGLAEEKHLFNTFKKLALEAQGIHSVVLQGPRLLPKWKQASSNIASCEYQNKEAVDVLDYCPMSSGEHRWAFTVLENGNQPAWLGIMVLKGKEVDYETSLGKQDCGWCCSSQGGVRHGERVEQSVLPTFKTGSKVTFTLNLCFDDGSSGNSGTLSVSVDGGMQLVLFSDLHSELEGQEGFVPAVSLRAPAQIKLTGIQRIK